MLGFNYSIRIFYTFCSSNLAIATSSLFSLLLSNFLNCTLCAGLKTLILHCYLYSLGCREDASSYTFHLNASKCVVFQSVLSHAASALEDPFSVLRIFLWTCLGPSSLPKVQQFSMISPLMHSYRHMHILKTIN